MIIWLDAQLSPSLAPWISEHFGIQAFSVKYLGYQSARDEDIFKAAREAGATMMTKDSDFIRLLELHGPPPQVLWVTLGNTSTARMKEVLGATLRKAKTLLEEGEPLVELRDAKSGS